ncbi:hypothetical protein PF004_g16149 [Phytophthora fragariae]|uniref:Uncharacterized protein n=1 Tax=Phytophthora fragariae TaxID=53985 RepID=A0A6G0NJ82_9STRA|nr:hypothetical protein PF004_g16149 [Phytophthora fragariae]
MRVLSLRHQTPVDKAKAATNLLSFQSGCRSARVCASGRSTNASEGNRRVYLSDRIRPEHYPGNRLTCHQIWHDMWKNGEERPPPRVGRDIQMRALGKKRRGSRVQDAGSGEAPEHEDEAKQAEQEEEDEEAEKEDEVEQEDEEAEKEDEQQE